MRRERCRGAYRRCAEVALLPWRWRRRPRRRSLLRRRRCRRRGRGGRCRGFRLDLRFHRRRGGRRLLRAHWSFDRFGRRRCGHQFDLHRVGVKLRHAGAGGHWIDVLGVGQVAVEREGDSQRPRGRQGERARRAASLSVRCLGVGARRRRLETDGVHDRRRLQRVKIHPIRGGRTCRKGQTPACNCDHSIHNVSTRPL